MKKIRLGSINVDITGTVKQDGVPVDISAATTHNLILTKPDATEVTKAASFVTSGIDGKLHFYTLASDVDQPGIYEVRADLIFPTSTGYDGDTFCGRFQVLAICYERVTNDEVKEILETTVDTTPFIRAAHVLVNDALTGKGLEEATLIEIERWLSAHFACMMDPREEQLTAGASVVFEGKTAMGLNFTRYGQMVKLLDTTGTLNALDKGRFKGRVTLAPRQERDRLLGTLI